ncbi:MAG: hypothetical protein R3A10_15570 [Caldilineaceae bacterium]
MPPYIVHWDSRDAANGLHEIRAKAVDTMGQWRDAGVIVEVDNPAAHDARRAEHCGACRQHQRHRHHLGPGLCA